ncbi:MAG: DUF262 domain-containing protein [Chloroflexi bacterium]|nr:DUF262 domain-containing protein [Chloroflexota bacterium]
MVTPRSKRDIEETEEELDRPEPTPVRFWEQKQRELVTSVVDYNLSTLADLIASNTIDMAPRYQRRFRWDTKRQSRLIESFLMNVPVPPVFLNEDQYGKYSVIDGKQRLTAVYEFLRGRLRLEGLEVFSDINGQTYDTLPADLQTIIKTRPTLRAVIILRQSDVEIKFEVFKRLNTGGIRLNPQEIRNSTYPGPLNDLILQLSEHTRFHALLGITNRQRSAIFLEMRDAEFVLRFFTFRDNWEEFSKGMQPSMDQFMALNQRMGRQELDDLKTSFLNTIDAVAAGFGDKAFQRWETSRQKWRSQVLASLFDAQMFACLGIDPDTLRRHHPAILAGMRQLFENTEFRRSIDAATNTPSFFRSRIKAVRAMITDVTAHE